MMHAPWRAPFGVLSVVRLFAAAVLAALLLSACGGGGGASPTVTPAVQLGIDVQPQDQSVVEGDSLSLNVVARHVDGYQWQQLSGGAWTAVPGATGSTLQMRATAELDGASFRVLVRGGGAELASSAVTVRVRRLVVAPSVLTHPAAATVMEGQDVTLHVTAQGTSLTYQWELSRPEGGWTEAPGGNAASLTWAVLALADDGRCARVRVSNSAGAVTSEPACVRVTPAPKLPEFLTQPADASAVERQNASFVVSAIGTPVPTLRWQTLGSGGWVDHGETRNTLTLGALGMADDGRQVRVIATNAAGSVTSRVATLRVVPYTVPPSIGGIANPAPGWAGMTPEMRAYQIGGIPAPTLQWQLSLDGGAWTNVNGATAEVYTAPPLAYGVKTRYRVVVSNSVGSATSDAVLYEPIALAPTITQDPISQQVTNNGTVTFSVTVDSAAPFTYQWREFKQVGVASFDWVDMPGETGRTLSLRNLTVPVDDQRRFAVRVTNPNSSLQSGSATLTVVSEPMPLVCSGAGESGWCWMNSKPQGNPLYGGAVWGLTRKLAVGAFGTILFSDDDGRTWRVRPSGTEMDLSGVAYASPSTAVAVGDGGVILRSGDGGRTWAAAASGVTERLRHVTASDGGVFIAVGDAGVMLRSADGGATWRRVAVGLFTDWFDGVAFADADIVVAVGWNGAMRSVDAGVTWTVQPPIAGVYGLRGVGFSRKTAGLGVATESFGISRTSNGGASWNDRLTSLPIVRGGGPVAFPYDDLDLVLTLQGVDVNSASDGAEWGTWAYWRTGFFAPTGLVSGRAGGQGFIVGTGGRMYQYRDKTLRKDEAFSAGSPDLGAMAFWDGQKGLAVGYGSDGAIRGGVLATQDGGKTWTFLASTTQPLLGVALPAPGVAIASSSDGGLLRSTDSGKTWTEVGRVGSAPVENLGASGTLAFAVGPNAANAAYGFIQRSTDGGQTWANNGPASIDAPRDVVVRGNTAVVVGDRGLVLRTIDGGATWTRIGAAVTDHLFGVAMNSGQVMLAVGAGGRILRSTDGGSTWSAVASGVTDALRGVRFGSATVAYAYGTEGRVLRSGDGGQTWTLQPRMTQLRFLAGWALDADTMLLGGEGGAILRTQTGGQ
ncbi:hypothetical protein CDN99_12115 [Roseateles aquatilis]|uniref:Immunoglobulin domain-containing protein n=1 Tax=Roseateles aquatilis TaxID=431061 RepID=A0A246JE73_9BURK|nr:YCF48-related protein [Roseateles aquatilis]OWQ90898.1 hypothetical protein CDN99_12115 [Roseateles aquatilis]